MGITKGATNMLVRVLGGIEAGGEPSQGLGGPTQRRVFAALVVRRNEAVSIGELVDICWSDDDAPDRAEHNVRTYVHRLRTALGEDGDRIETASGAYRLRVEPSELDIGRFEESAGAATRLLHTGDITEALDRIDHAEELWRGRPYGEFADEPWAMPEVARLTELRWSMHERRAEAQLTAGRPGDAVASLESMIVDEPLRERPRALLMRALYESGRQAEALRAFQEFRRLLVDEVGVEPSSVLVELDRAIASGGLVASAARPRTVGNYELHERIGEGAFAVVHRATQASLGREVAVKVVRAELANRPEFIRRFEAEAQMVAAVEHPNVVPLYDYWREPGQAFLVMRWMTGGSLESRLDDGPWSLDATVELVDQIAGALTASHDHGVVHRDVKPGNILFDDAGRAYLGDFGIALSAEERSTPQSALSEGSPVFASPEQLRREPAGPEADVYALAIVAFTVLTGRTPFAESRDTSTLLRRQLDEPVPGVSTFRRDVPSAVDDVILVATAKEPGDRYPTASGFSAAFRVAAGVDVAGKPSSDVHRERVNPYLGLRAFSEADADAFFGRERLIDELVGHLVEPDQHLLAVVGPSGSGKSSVVRAGLVPALREGRVPGSAQWFATTMIPGSRPFESLETALLRVAVNPPGSLLDQLRDGDRGVLRGIRRILPDDEGVLLIVIDQFEEVFQVDVADADRDQFLRALAVAVTEPGSPLRVVLTLRADFYDEPLRHPEFAPLIKRHTLAVTPLAPDELEEAITRPTANVGVGFEPGLVAEMAADVNSQPGALPLLQFALTRAFDQSAGPTISVDDYRTIGGLSGALARRAEDVWQNCEPDEREAARRLFGRLVTLGEGTEDTRRRVGRSELPRDPATDVAIDRFGQARLLTFDHNPATREPTVEVAHEALIREWHRLRDWLDDDRDTLRVHRHLTAAATGWTDSGRDPSELYRGARLDVAEPLLTSQAIALNDTESDFLLASVRRSDEEAEEERHRLRRLHRLVAATAVVATLALIAGAVALLQWQRADDQAALAVENETQAIANAERAAANEALATTNADQAAANADRAAESAALADARAEEAEAARQQADLERLRAVALAGAEESPAISALLAVEAHHVDGSVESLDALHRVMTEIPGYRGSIPWVSYTGQLLDDDLTLVTAGPTSIVSWDLSNRTQIHSVAHESPSGRGIVDVLDGARVAAVGADRMHTVLYDLEAAHTLLSFPHAAVVNDIAIDRDSMRLAAALETGAVEIWDLERADLIVTLDAGTDAAYFVKWSPAGDRLAVVTLGSVVGLWETSEFTQLWETEPPPADIVNQLTPFAAIFSPSGDRFLFVSGSVDGKVRTLDTAVGNDIVAPADIVGAAGFVLDSMFWIDDDTVALPTGRNVMSYDIGSESASDVVLDRFVGRARSVVFSDALDQFVIAGGGGLEFWSTDGSGVLERVIPLTPEHQAVVEAGGPVLASLASDGSRAIASVFASPLPPPAVSYDLSPGVPSPELFDSATVAIGYGDYTWAGVGFAGQMLDADFVPLGDPVPLPFDFTELGASEDGRFWAVGRLGGLADVYRSSGELLGTVALGDASDFAGAQTAPWFTSDGRYLVLNTTDQRSGLWTTEPLERVDVPAERERLYIYAAGPWLFASAGQSVTERLDPDTLQPIGGPISLNGLASLGYPKVDEVNERLAATGTGTVAVFDLEAGRQLGRELPHTTNVTSRIEFTADGSLLSVPSNDRITLWNFDTDTWADTACEFAGRNLTREEWEQFGPRTVEYRATCPEYPIEG